MSPECSGFWESASTSSTCGGGPRRWGSQTSSSASWSRRSTEQARRVVRSLRASLALLGDLLQRLLQLRSELHRSILALTHRRHRVVGGEHVADLPPLLEPPPEQRDQ